MSVNTDTQFIEDILNRGVESLYPNREYVHEQLSSGKPLTIYFGIDPTGPTLHIGHSINLLKLKKLQKAGHHIKLLIGDFTAMIGDPTDKMAARFQMTREEVLENAKLYKEQASVFLDFGGENPAEIVYNSSWLDGMTFRDVLSLASKLTVQEMLKRDMFKRRIAEEKPIYIHEFMYPLMQGYDSVVLDTDMEIGGNDQTFNMLAGRTLMKHMAEKDKMVIAMKLLVDPTGKKMGKSEGNMVTMQDSPEDMYGKVMSWGDDMIVPGFELCTEVSQSEIKDVVSQLEEDTNPKELKMRLAREIVSMYHTKEEAEDAQKSFEEVFARGGIPEDMEKVEVEAGSVLADVVVGAAIVSSKSQFRRLVDQGAVTYADTGEKINDALQEIQEGMVLKIGKRRFLKIHIL